MCLLNVPPQCRSFIIAHGSQSDDLYWIYALLSRNQPCRKYALWEAVFGKIWWEEAQRHFIGLGAADSQRGRNNVHFQALRPKGAQNPPHIFPKWWQLISNTSKPYKIVHSKIHIWIGYWILLPPFKEYTSLGGFICALMYIFCIGYLLPTFGEYTSLGGCRVRKSTFFNTSSWVIMGHIWPTWGE